MTEESAESLRDRLTRQGEERTAVRVTVRADGGVGDVNTLPRRLVPTRRAPTAGAGS